MNVPETVASATKSSPVPSLELREVSKSFGDLEVLREVSLTVAPGAFVSLVGPSGCGKSTLLEIAAGLMTPSGGRVLVAGEELTGAAGYMPQGDHLLPYSRGGRCFTTSS